MHPLVVRSMTAAQIKSKALHDLKSHFFSPRLKPLLDYLLKNWYGDEKIEMWGRRSVHHGIAFARTTMYVEAHWYILKRHYLIFHNRARIDFIVHLIDKRLIPRFIQDLERYGTGTKTPSWWTFFMSEWRKCLEAPIRGQYLTLNHQWYCSCQAYCKSRFVLCKHLVDGQRPPEYRSVIRSRFPPFLSFKREDSWFHVLFDGDFVMKGITKQISYAGSAPVLPELNDLYTSQRCSQSADPVQMKVTAIIETSKWLGDYANALQSSGSGAQQLSVIHERLQPIMKMKEEVEKNHGARTMPRTWGNQNKLFDR